MFDKPDTKTLELGVAAGAGAIALGALMYKQSTAPPKVVEEKYQGGESYADPPKVRTGLKEDIASMSTKEIFENAQTLLEVFKNKKNHLPDDDKKMLVGFFSKIGGLDWKTMLIVLDGTDDQVDRIAAGNVEKSREAHTYDY